MTATLLLAGAALVAGAATAQAREAGGITAHTESLRGPFSSQAACDQQRATLLSKTDGSASDCVYESATPLNIGPGWYFEFFNNPYQ